MHMMFDSGYTKLLSPECKELISKLTEINNELKEVSVSGTNLEINFLEEKKKRILEALNNFNSK